MIDETFWTDEKLDEIARKAETHIVAAEQATEAILEYEKAFKQRSFSGRHPELGPMIKCVECGRRHRDNIKHDFKYANKPGTPEGESNPMIAQAKRIRVKGNPFWPVRRGIMVWFNTLHKFVKLA
jgi:hypothetical protein